ncbi:hypothetical protein EYF80_057190 [Liparis tanakae]|uniref:Uncharacterized protein n=1 Tax=Liparis tanakae TaxID=230148 RepID=A0A4Z2EUZ2_9TELE|nr:hypothetical protein EYF80_057190 [Liparis tanakae]
MGFVSAALSLQLGLPPGAGAPWSLFLTHSPEMPLEEETLMPCDSRRGLRLMHTPECDVEWLSEDRLTTTARRTSGSGPQRPRQVLTAEGLRTRSAHGARQLLGERSGHTW